MFRFELARVLETSITVTSNMVNREMRMFSSYLRLNIHSAIGNPDPKREWVSPESHGLIRRLSDCGSECYGAYCLTRRNGYCKQGNATWCYATRSCCPSICTVCHCCSGRENGCWR